MAKKTVAKSEPRKVFLVQYEGYSTPDPVKEFKTFDEAKEFVAELFTDGDGGDYSAEDIDKSSIKVYEAILIGKPKIEVIFTV